MILSELSSSTGGILSVVALKGLAFSPFILMLATKCLLWNCDRSVASNCGSKYLTKKGLSSGLTRKLTMLPTLPNTASRTGSAICEIY